VTNDTIAIMNEEVPVRRERHPIDDINFLPDNPRVYAAIQDMTDFAELTPDEQQVRIYERMKAEPSVKKLRRQIKEDGGLQEPIIIRWDTQQVIEGNSRLAAYRQLRDANPDDEHWHAINCLVLSSLTDEQQTRLLGQAHLQGKTEWTPHAKALYCYRWVKEEGRVAKALAKISGISVKEITTSIKIITLMNSCNETKTSNFSYYEVLVRNRAISSAMKTNVPLRDTLLSSIKAKDFTAQQLRERLPVVIKKPRLLKKFVTENATLEDAWERAKVNDLQNKLRTIQTRLHDIEQADLVDLERNDLQAAAQTLKKIGREIDRVKTMLTAQLEP